jgi:hypothetical protein
MKKIILIFSLLLLLVLTITSQTTQQLKVYDDTYLYKGTSGSGDEITGLEAYLYTYHSTAGSQYRRETFLRFDISTLSTFLKTVKLRVYANALPEAHTFNLYPLTKTTWVEDDLTFNNKATKAGADITTVYTTASGPVTTNSQYYEFDVTSIVKDSINKGAQFIGFRLRDATVVKTTAGAAALANWHSKENPSGNFPMLQYVEQEISTLKLQTLSIDGNPLNGFNSSKYKYFVILPWDATVIPTVTAVTNDITSTMVVTPASSLTGTESARTTKVVVTNSAGTLTYNVVFQLLPSPTVADISTVTIGGKTIDNFSINTTNYTVNVPYNWDINSLVVAKPVDETATYVVKAPVNLDGTDSEKTMAITCTSANKQVTKQYNIIINKLPELDIILAMGQSQMAGRASYANEGSAPIPNVYLLTPGLYMEPATNPLNRYANITKDATLDALSPAYSFVKKLQPLINRPIGIMVNAQGGSSITSWYQPGKPNYDASLKRIKEIVKYGKVKGIIWHQGSADNSAAVADNFVTYKANLNAMVENFRKDLGIPDLFFICGELSDGRPEFDAFNLNVIQTLKSYVSNADYIMATGTLLLSDGIHWDAPSVLMMGERYADKFLADVYNNTATNNFIENSTPSITTSNGKLKIENVKCDLSFRVYDIVGKLVKKRDLATNEYFEMSVSKGIYLVSYTQNSNLRTIKVIVH